MLKWLDAAGDVAAAATALSGLLLVFIGAVTSAYQSYETTARKAVRGRFLTRGALSFAGFVFSLVSAVAALSAKVVGSPCLVIVSLAFLGLAFGVVLVAGALTVWEIR